MHVAGPKIGVVGEDLVAAERREGRLIDGVSKKNLPEDRS